MYCVSAVMTVTSPPPPQEMLYSPLCFCHLQTETLNIFVHSPPFPDACTYILLFPLGCRNKGKSDSEVLNLVITTTKAQVRILNILFIHLLYTSGTLQLLYFVETFRFEFSTCLLTYKLYAEALLNIRSIVQIGL